jgi:hypothetical protein
VDLWTPLRSVHQLQLLNGTDDQMFTDFVNECGNGRGSTMRADDVKLSASETASVAAPQQPAA